MAPVLLIWGFVLLLGTCIAGENFRIAGGSLSSIQTHPSLVQVEFLNIFTDVWVQSCGGAILTRFHILSSAHCFDGILYQPEYRRIRAGTNIRHTGGQVSYVRRAINHPDYGQEGYIGDISVVELIEPLTYTPVVQQGILAAQGSTLPENTPVVKAGWGIVSADSLASSDLLEVTVLTANLEECKNHYLSMPTIGLVTDDMICTGINPGSGNACQGDMGGPLYYGDVMMGVMSWGDGCSNDSYHYPVVSIAVSSYTNWIIAAAGNSYIKMK